MDTMDIVKIGKAFSDENRVRILQMLVDGEKCGCKLLEAFEITQPTLSHHMKILCESGLVDARKEGKWSYYSVNGDEAREFEKYINKMRGGHHA